MKNILILMALFLTVEAQAQALRRESVYTKTEMDSFLSFKISSSTSGVDIQSVYFGSGASCLSPCTTATCTICKQIGNKITSITRTTNGTYNLNGIDGTKYQCTGTANNSSTAVGVLDNEGSSTTSFRRIVTYNGGVTTDSGMASIQCIGVP